MQPLPQPAAIDAARVLWRYMKMDQPAMNCDCIIAMGSHDLRVAEHAAQLMLEGRAPLLVCSGGLGRLTRKLWREPEARKFARIARQMGVPSSYILIEDQSTNTGQNIQFSRDLLRSKGYSIRSALLVHKPYMERRSLATALKVWSEISYCVSSPPGTLEDYPNRDISMENLIQVMVGDFQRILVYPRLGFQVPQDVPAPVMAAYDELVEMGYTRDLVKQKDNGDHSA
ncbi:MAG: hypothetical protein PWQ55_1090 [Chloroflexota bacterium]|nr:hypothetical protein [Chloroflexota bacterium]